MSPIRASFLDRSKPSATCHPRRCVLPERIAPSRQASPMHIAARQLGHSQSDTTKRHCVRLSVVEQLRAIGAEFTEVGARWHYRNSGGRHPDAKQLLDRIPVCGWIDRGAPLASICDPPCPRPGMQNHPLDEVSASCVLIAELNRTARTNFIGCVTAAPRWSIQVPIAAYRTGVELGHGIGGGRRGISIFVPGSASQYSEFVG